MTHDHADMLAEILAQAKAAGAFDLVELIECCSMAKHGPDGKWQCWVTPQEFARIVAQRAGADHA